MSCSDADGALPSGNSVQFMNFVRIGRITAMIRERRRDATCTGYADTSRAMSSRRDSASAAPIRISSQT